MNPLVVMHFLQNRKKNSLSRKKLKRRKHQMNLRVQYTLYPPLNQSTVHTIPTTRPEYSTHYTHHSTRVQYTLYPPLNQSTVHTIPTTRPEYSTHYTHHSTRVQYTLYPPLNQSIVHSLTSHVHTIHHEQACGEC